MECKKNNKNGFWVIIVIYLTFMSSCSSYLYRKAEKQYYADNESISIKYLDKIIVQKKNDFVTQKANAFKKYIEAEYVSAAFLYEKISEQKRNDDIALLRLGICNLYLFNHQKALQSFDMALKINSRNGTTYFNRAICYFDLEQYDNAIIDFKKAMELDTDYVLYSSIGACYYWKEEYRKAIEFYDLAIAINNSDDCITKDNLYWTRGNCKFNIGNIEAAIIDYKKALKHNSNKVEIYEDMAEAYVFLNDSINACLCIKKAFDSGIVDSLKVSKYCK